VFALALPLSFLRLRGVWRRILLMAGAMLIAALANGVRVALIGALSYYEVGTPLHGPFHILNGLFVSLVGFIALFVGLRILQPADQPTTAVTEVAQPSNAALRPRWRVHEAFALAVVFWAVVFVGVAPDAVPVALAQPLETVPARLGTWSIDTTSPTAPELEAWNTADDHFRRHYRRSDGQQATVDIWYFKFQSQRREIIGSRVGDLHRLSTPKSVQLANGATLDANAVRWPDTNHVGLFWYDLGGSTESNPYATMLRSLWNVIRAGRNNGAVIMLSAPLKDPSDAGVATALEDLARELQPVLVSVWQIRPRSSN
jgi:EpsI family protein